MAQKRLTLRKLVLHASWPLIHAATGTPDVAFPFNSQVPTVARVGRPYSFQLSSSTFAPENTNFTYGISDEPAWLSLDGSTRLLSGTPGQADAGAATFTISAADAGGAAHMACTLVVSANPPPQLEGNIPQELAATANLSSIQPPTATFLPLTPFRFQFQQSTFIDIVRRKLYYYSTLSDHTPLPAWLQFDPDTLTFSGTTPQLSAFPQSWGIDLIASDVAGFAGTTVSFTIAISTDQLIFVPEQVAVNISGGVLVNYTGLQNALFRNGKHLALGGLESAKATVPEWLSFDSNTLALSGTPPPDVKDQTCTATVEDQLGDQATVVISLIVGQDTIFAGSIGTLMAHAGQMFTYHIPSSLFTKNPDDITLTLPSVATWLHFNPGTRVLSGRFPNQSTMSSIKATLEVRPSSEAQVQTQTFTIDVVPSKETTTKPSNTASSHSQPTQQLSSNGSGSHLNNGIVAAVVLGVLLAAALFAAFLYFLRRRREREPRGVSGDETKRSISRPIVPPGDDSIVVTTEVQRDIEMAVDGDMASGQVRDSDQAPRIGLDLGLDRRSRIMRWTKRFSRISQVSSLGMGEDAIRRDTNIPVLGGESMAAHTPHHSFSVSTEMARASLPLAELSPTKRALRRVRAKLPGARSVGLGIDTQEAAAIPRFQAENTGILRRKASSVAASAAAAEHGSVASFSTRGTSVLSTRPSDFPRPPARSGWPSRGAKLGMARADMNGRKSIRVVHGSDSITDKRDERPMAEKRQSFIRNRASTGIASPLFSHGSRLSSGVRHSMLLGTLHSQRGNSGLASPSKSSPMEPPVQQSQRHGAKERFAFAPSFPRALTKSTLGADHEASRNRDSSSFYTTDEEMSEPEYLAEMHLPRHQRSWVVPGEASPTPTPVPPTSPRSSSVRQGTPPSASAGRPRAKWERRLREHSTSPMTTATAVPRRSRLSEPLSLVSNDSLSRARQNRPRPALMNSSRPVSVEQVRRMSSLPAETEDTRPGSEMFEALKSAGLMPRGAAEGSRGASQRSNASGPAFL